MIIEMYRGDAPYLADWFAISLRWLALLGLAAALAMGGALNPLTAGLLIFTTFWNLFITFLAILNRRLAGHRLINVLLDGAVSVALFITSGGLSGPVAWAGVLVLFSGAMYYEWAGALIAGLVVSLVQVGWMFYRLGSALDPLAAAALVAGTAAVGLVMGLLSFRLMRYIRGAYQSQVRQRNDVLGKARQQERHRMQTFYQLIETLSATLDYQVVLDASLDLSATALGDSETAAAQLVSAVLLFGEHDLMVGAARHLSAVDMKQTLPAAEGALHEAVTTGQPQLVLDPTNDPEISRLTSLETCKVALCLPLQRGLNAYGVMLFAHPEPDFFTTERRDLLELISHQSVVAIQNARLYQDLAEEKERLIVTQEEARKKLARDLHDGPTQSVSAIAMQVNIASKLLELRPDEVPAELVKIEDLARRTVQEIRHMLFTLRPLALESEGLAAALQAMADKMRDTYQQRVEVKVDPLVVDLLEPSKQPVVFFLAEEAVNNARKHAKAGLIRVKLNFFPQNREFALLEVIDNGVGFDIKSVNTDYDRRGSLGMVNLRERAELINGLLRIDSVPGRGTRVRVVIPLTSEAADQIQRGMSTQNT